MHGLSRLRLSIRQPIDQVALNVGDVLLLDAPVATLAALRADPGLVILGQCAQPRIDARRAIPRR